MLKLTKKRNPRFAGADFSRAFSGVEMFPVDECRPRQIDCIVVDHLGSPALVSYDVDDVPVSSLLFS
jgi:hypothetical protein